MELENIYRSDPTDEEGAIHLHSPLGTYGEANRTAFQRLLIKIEGPALSYIGSYAIAGHYEIKPLVLNKVFDERYELPKEIPFDPVYIEDGIYYLVNSELGLLGSGLSVSDAIRECAADLIDLFEEYNDNPELLTDSALEFRDLLNKYIIRKR